MNFTRWMLVGMLMAQTSSFAMEAGGRPNLLFICVDDLKPLLGCYGDAGVKSPNMDRLAASGVRFDRMYCNQAVCGPSRNSLLTGLRPTTVGLYDLKTFFRGPTPDVITLPQWFMRHGWQTESLGKVFHTDNGNHDDPVSWSVPHYVPQTPLYALKEDLAAGSHDPLGRGPAVECADVPDDAFTDGLTANEAVRRLGDADHTSEKPWLMFVGFRKPHLPFVAPKKYWDLYERSSFEPDPIQTPPVGAPAFAPTTWKELRNYTDVPDIGPLSADQQRELIHGYHAAISYVDAQVGRVLDELNASGLASNTIVVLWGDNGWHLGDHGMWAKHTDYEQAAHIPMLIRVPGMTPQGVACPALVENVDLYPTLCDLAGLPHPSGLDGKSFVNALKDPAHAKIKEAIFHVYPRSPRGMGEILGRAVRTERYRLVEWKKPGAKADSAILEFYDYQTDPNETVNLASERPEDVAKLCALLAEQPEAKPQWHSTTNSPASDSARTQGKKQTSISAKN